MATETEIYGGDYRGPSYELTRSVNNLRQLPRFGHSSDFTAVFSPYQDEQVDYAAGLIALFVFLLIIFIFWTIAIVVFKAMGPANAGFLSGYHFVVPDPAEDVKGIYKRPFRVRVVFLVATGFVMLFAFLFVSMGLTNVNNAVTTMGKSLKRTEELLQNAEMIGVELETVGTNSITIRDAAVNELENLCPNNPNIAEAVNMDINGIAEQAQGDLTTLADFISVGLEVLNENLALIRSFAREAEKTTVDVTFWNWQMKLLVSGLFILPSFLAVGVGLVMLDVEIKPYQKALTYFFMPLFAVTIVACYVVCCAILPISATSADACAGGGAVRAGPDDTILTVYRNIRGEDTGPILNFVGFYTQRCDPEYYPFDFLSSYMNDLDKALDSTNMASDAVRDNQGLLEEQCGRNFDNVIDIVKNMNDNLKLLRRQADRSLDLIQCKNINQLYVNTVHEAGCTYSVDALAWIFASSLVISVAGLIMIMLRSAYLPVEYLDLGEEWITNKVGHTKSASKDSEEGTDPVTTRPLEAVPEAGPIFVPQSVNISQMNDDEFEMGPGYDL
eukprot:CAMPEP_0183717194 /NCGR_PEP_ID=MMETSP0737-20130205/10867_1 /TAXON_ID=385413 /ORGANISM="Thalassiosira miniscula, Strain CCMP1093" /LENGTH=557 /DNA_ID=CAMNT_0025946587 /DNA_START=315 /DNA_END=1988 /DNA_ORIENTATION=-